MSEPTMVYDAKDKILGRLASHVAKEMISARKSGRQQSDIIINAEDAIFSGPRTKVLSAGYLHSGALVLGGPERRTVVRNPPVIHA